MLKSKLPILAIWCVLVSLPAVAMAGMGYPVLTDWAEMRIETLSFFVFVLLVATAVIRGLWNYLAKDFPALPRLGYRKTLAAVILCGLFFISVLTMIAGARELLTPGAWQKQGLLYKVAATPPLAVSPAPAAQQQLDRRKEQLRKLQKALWHYASQHDKQFPKDDASPEIASALWELPDVPGGRYFYIPGLKADSSLRVLVYEPDVYGPDRVVLRTNGEIAVLSTVELRKQLAEKKP